MATPRLNALSINLSQLLNDEVSVHTASGEEFTFNQRLLALNRAEGTIISKAVADLDLENIIKNLQELIKETDITPADSDGISSVASPTGSVRIVSALATLQCIYIPPKDWYDYRRTYTPSVTDNFRWTEFGRTFYIKPSVSPVTVLYVKDHVDLTYDGANDLMLPARFHTEILKNPF